MKLVWLLDNFFAQHSFVHIISEEQCYFSITEMVPSQKKRYKSCQWGGTLSQCTNMYTSGTDMYLLGVNTVQRCTF